MVARRQTRKGLAQRLMTRIDGLSTLFRRWQRGQSGQTLVEYALIIALVAIALVGTMASFGGGVDGLYGVIQTVVDTLGGSSSG